MNMEVKYTSHNVLLTPTFNRLKHTKMYFTSIEDFGIDNLIRRFITWFQHGIALHSQYFRPQTYFPNTVQA